MCSERPETTYDTVLQLENNIENQDRHQKENEKKIEKGTIRHIFVIIRTNIFLVILIVYIRGKIVLKL